MATFPSEARLGFSYKTIPIVEIWRPGRCRFVLVSGCVYPDRERYRREEQRREGQNQAATGQIVGQETVVPTLPPAPVAEVATPSPRSGICLGCRMLGL